VPAPGQPDKTQHCLGRMVRFSGARKPPFRRPNTGLHIGISISISKTAPRTITSTVRRVSGAAAAPPRQGCAGCPAQPSPAQSPPPEPGKIGCQHEPAPGDGRMDGKDGWATHTPARTRPGQGRQRGPNKKKIQTLGSMPSRRRCDGLALVQRYPWPHGVTKSRGIDKGGATSKRDKQLGIWDKTCFPMVLATDRGATCHEHSSSRRRSRR